MDSGLIVSACCNATSLVSQGRCPRAFPMQPNPFETDLSNNEFGPINVLTLRSWCSCFRSVGLRFFSFPELSIHQAADGVERLRIPCHN